jgi:dephospho-CoA kinase
MVFRIALTGGIGSGKSSVCALFAELGVPIVDADIVARQLVEPGRPALKKLVGAFGEAILNRDASLNRPMLRHLAFSDAHCKQTLDAIMHPLIYAEIERQVNALSTPYCIMAIPLLVETRNPYTVDRILVVDCPEEMQRQRVMARDRLDRAQTDAIMAAQSSRAQRLTLADDVIENTGVLAGLAEQVKNLHNSYLLLATARKSSA